MKKKSKGVKLKVSYQVVICALLLNLSVYERLAIQGSTREISGCGKPLGNLQKLRYR